MNAAEVNVNRLSWPAFNNVLLECEDQVQLRRWLDAVIEDGTLSRILRVYGRYATVRRAQEVAAIKKNLKQRKRTA